MGDSVNFRIFWAILIVVGYSIGVFWLGSYVDRKSLNQSLAFQNYEFLQDNARANEEILSILRGCGREE